MRVLGVETSCDETAVALLDGGRVVESLVYSQLREHEPYGGVVPELAARRHLETLPSLYRELKIRTGLDPASLDAIAVTNGPGLLGCLLVGLNFAKALSFAHGVPLVGVNHLEGHLCSVELAQGAPEPPWIALLVSGGHTSLYVVEKPGVYRQIGATRDDAAGEAFDKGAKILGLGYPGGPAVDRAARAGNEKAYAFPGAFIRDSPYDLSFSGLKTAVLYKVRDLTGGGKRTLTESETADLAASLQRAVVLALTRRIERAVEDFGIPAVVVVGGVAANSRLRREAGRLESRGIRCFLPPPAYCTDNAAMIALAAHARLGRGEPAQGLTLGAHARLPLADRMAADSPIPRRRKPRVGR